MSKVEFNRAGKNLQGGTAILLVQLGEEHIEILKTLLKIDKALAFYYFARCFEESNNKYVNESTVHVFVTELVVGEESQESWIDDAVYKVFPVRADISISLERYAKLRLPWREGTYTYPPFSIIE